MLPARDPAACHYHILRFYAMNDRTCPILYIVIPCYNEQEVLPITAPMFLQKINDLAAAGKISPDSRVLFVNDGSKDRTWEIINERRHLPKPQPRPPERRAGGLDGGKEPLRHHHFHRLRRPGRHQRHGRHGGCLPRRLRYRLRRAQQAGYRHVFQAFYRREFLQNFECHGCGSCL